MRPDPLTEQRVFTFGRMVLDKRHKGFGAASPTVFVIADMWSNEYEDEDVMVDHYRGHFRIKFADLENSEWYQPLGLVDTSKDVHEQCKAAEESIQDKKGKQGE